MTRHRMRWMVIAAGAVALGLMVGATQRHPARASSGVAWLLTVSRRPGGLLASGGAGGPSDGILATGAPSESAVVLVDDTGRARTLTARFAAAWTPSPTYDASRLLFVARIETGSAPAIWEMRTDGSGARRVTGGRGAPAEPVDLPDGRVLFTDLGDDGGAPSAARALYSCMLDGGDLRRLTFGPHVDRHPAVLRDGRVGFERVLREGGATDALRLTIHPDGTGLAPRAGDDAPGPAPLEAIPDETGLSAAIAAAAIAAAAPRGYEIAETRKLAVRPVPPVLTSVVRSDRTAGTLLCLDVYASRLPRIATLARGVVRKVQFAAAEGGAPLGEAPVHPDGSFFVEVPADTLLLLTLLGDNDRPLATMSRGLSVRPNENRGCVGCHEPPDLAPKNRRPIAVSGPPVQLAPARMVRADGPPGGRSGAGGPDATH